MYHPAQQSRWQDYQAVSFGLSTSSMPRKWIFMDLEVRSFISKAKWKPSRLTWQIIYSAWNHCNALFCCCNSRNAVFPFFAGFLYYRLYEHYYYWAQSFTLLKADLRQNINWGIWHLAGALMKHFLEGFGKLTQKRRFVFFTAFIWVNVLMS